jgi:hypothetical protein
LMLLGSVLPIKEWGRIYRNNICIDNDIKNA